MCFYSVILFTVPGIRTPERGIQNPRLSLHGETPDYGALFRGSFLTQSPTQISLCFTVGDLGTILFLIQFPAQPRRQRGRVNSVSDSQSGGPGFESRSSHLLDLFSVVPGSNPRPRL